MKLLLDENLSPRLVDRLNLLFPVMAHVREVGLAASDDQRIWEWARDHGFAILTTDADFVDLASFRAGLRKSSTSNSAISPCERSRTGCARALYGSQSLAETRRQAYCRSDMSKPRRAARDFTYKPALQFPKSPACFLTAPGKSWSSRAETSSSPHPARSKSGTGDRTR